MDKSFADQVTLARIEPGMWVYTSPDATDDGKVDLPNPSYAPGVARRVKVPDKTSAGRSLIFEGGLTTAPRNGTTMVYRLHLQASGKPVPIPTYPVCPSCGAGENEPACKTKAGAMSPNWHASREKARKAAPKATTPKGPVHVEVDGVVVAKTERKDVTPAKPAKPKGKGTVRKDDLVHGLTAIRELAGDDGTLPVLMGVKVECGPGDSHLTLAATDRYVLGSIRVPWDGGEVDALLPADTVKDLLAFARKADKAVPIELTFERGQLVADDMLRKATYPLDTEHEFVKWRAVLPDVERYADGEAFGVNPAFIGRFAKAAREKGETMVVRFWSPLKPLRVEIGDHFVGLIMPVRLPDQAEKPVRFERSEPEPVAPAAEPGCPECGHEAGLHYAPGTGDPKQRCRAFTCGCSTDFGVRQLDTVDGTMAAASVGESGRRVERDVEGKVRILDWTGGERDSVTPAGKRVHIDAEGVVTHLATPPAVEPEPVEHAGEGKCFVCKGFGVVRKRGSRAGGAYKTASGAQVASQGGNATECPTCHGEGAWAA